MKARFEKDRLRWFGHVMCKDDTDCMKCTTMAVDVARKKEHPR